MSAEHDSFSGLMTERSATCPERVLSMASENVGAQWPVFADLAAVQAANLPHANAHFGDDRAQ